MAAKKYDLSLFVFRRDLRLNDNTGLIEALRLSKSVIAAFIFDPRQVSDQNSYRSMACIQFMIESLVDLDGQLKKHGGRLYFFHDQAEHTVEQLIKKEKINAVFFNKDYTPFSIKRDQSIENICATYNVDCLSFHDALLNEPSKILNAQNKPYEIFTSFYKRSIKEPIQKPQKLTETNFYTQKIATEVSHEIIKKMLPHRRDLYVTGGRSACTKILDDIKQFKTYLATRDIPSIDTTLFGAHNKFGTYSIREIYHTIKELLGPDHALLRQLYWRDFFTHVAAHAPRVFGMPFHEKYKDLPWNTSKADFKSWCDGKTGFPIVDAGMRQLNETGFMHNRVRMIVASFLVKDLHINWLWGEKYFAQQLIDYDPAVNNGNWQWSASTGCDASPYFRIFNPWLQQEKFDPECIYIKRWVAELKNVDNKKIHKWYNAEKSLNDYPLPMVDHKKESEITKKEYRRAGSTKFKLG